MMRYEGNIYRPPSEAYSLIVQVTIGCAHNACTFCSMFKDKTFRVRPEEEVLEDLREARRTYRKIGRIFLADGDALVLSNERLLRILAEIEALFPECERVSVYGSPQDVLRKTPAELEELAAHGVGFLYIGAESGSDNVLARIQKGAARDEIAAAIRKIEAAGIKASVTFIAGLGGPELSEEHARESGRLIGEAQPSYVGLLTLILEPGAPMYDEVQTGKCTLLSPAEITRETLTLLDNVNIENAEKECVFRSNHASNYVSLKGTLPQDKERMMNQLRAALENRDFKDDYFRRL
jgi:radical SAM superfamily enzyme YgiQ (UPF0313 family)